MKVSIFSFFGTWMLFFGIGLTITSFGVAPIFAYLIGALTGIITTSVFAALQLRRLFDLGV